jgi:nucleoside-diphosphate-sugar epimerase
VRNRETVLIAGCGDLGQRVGRLLVAQGQRVFGLRRRPLALPAGIEPLSCDLAAAVPVLPPVTRVVFCAAPDNGEAQAYRSVYETAFAHLLQALQNQPERPRRALLVTSTRCYGQADGSWVDEQSPVGAGDAQTASLLAAEALLYGSDLPGVVLRPGGLYGAGEGPLLRSLREGRAVCPAGPPRWTNRMHRDDAARAIVHLLYLLDPQPLYLGVDCVPADQCTVLRQLADLLGLPPPATRPVPPPRVNRRCSNARLLASGFSPLYPSFLDGYRALLAARE